MKKISICALVLTALALGACGSKKAAEEQVDKTPHAVSDARKAFLRARYGENHKITGDYDKSLAVKCINGTFVGQKDSDVVSFRGIPFVGEQPVGKNRFKAPVPFKADNGVYEAYHFQKAPSQFIGDDMEESYAVQGEDCLYLNVWKNTKDETPNKPVMVWIHGGAFAQGAAVNPLYEGFNFVKDNADVIFVSIEYRVGGFGFIRLADLPDGADYPDAQNLGLLDQAMALKWVYENIAGFGGDPKNITIFGESAGGCSVTVLPLMVQAKPYIHRVIAQSGTPVFTRSTEEGIADTKEIMKMLNISTVKELLEMPAEKINDTYANMSLKIWAERDGRILPKDIYGAIEQGATKDIDFIGGFNKDEAGQFVYFMGGWENFNPYFAARFEKKFPAMDKQDAENCKAFMAAIPEEKDKIRKLADQIYFIAPAMRVAENHTKAGGKFYQYYFRVEASYPDFLSGHAVEMPSVLNNPKETHYTGRTFDLMLGRVMQRMWVNFAKTGNPSLTAEESPTGKAITWEPYNTENKPIMVFDEFEFKPSTESEYHFIDWERTYPLTKYYIF